MALLIDGYNLLYVSGFLGRRRGPGTLARARAALLNYLAATLTPEQLPRTTVVFDSRQTPWGGAAVTLHRGIQVRYAVGFAEADDLIEQLIQQDSAPRRLTIVSSDHRLQRAARRRRAMAVDSEDWLESVRRRAAASRDDAMGDEPPRDRVLSETEIEAWLEHFGDLSDSSQSTAEEADRPFPADYGDDLVGDP